MRLKKKVEAYEKEEQLLYELAAVYSINKRRFIEAEEILPDMTLFVAPLLEHRDAFDHIMRYYEIQKNGESKEKGIEELEKSLGHEYRAFFDVADFICIKTRSYINESLKKYSLRKILKVWPDYKTEKEKIIKSSEEVRDIRSTRRASKELVLRYNPVLNVFLDIYKKYLTEIEPRLYK